VKIQYNQKGELSGAKVEICKTADLSPLFMLPHHSSTSFQFPHFLSLFAGSFRNQSCLRRLVFFLLLLLSLSLFFLEKTKTKQQLMVVVENHEACGGGDELSHILQPVIECS